MAQPIISPTFAAGELSPSLYGRVDLAKFHAGAALLENFFVDYRGGASNRPGTRFVGSSPSPDKPSRLIPFIFSASQAYVLVFDDHLMRVIVDGGFVAGSGSSDYSIITPYDGNDLALLKYTQSADVMTLTHPNYAPRQLTRTASDNWILSTISFIPTVEAPANAVATPSDGSGASQYRYVVTAIAANGVTESLPSDPAESTVSATMSTTGGAHISVTWDGVTSAQLYNVYRQGEVPDGIAAAGQLYGFIGTTTGMEFVDANIAPDFSRTPPQANNPFTSNNPGVVDSLSISPGFNYQIQPTLVFSGGGGGGAAADVFLTGLAVFAGGSSGTGYTLGDDLTAIGGSGSRPLRIKVVNTIGGHISGMQLVDGGSYDVPPGSPSFGGSMGFINVSGGTGSGAQIGASFGLGDYAITNAGSGYTSAPSVAVVGGGPSASGGAVIANIVPQIINNPGCVTYYQQRQVFAGSVLSPETFYASKPADYANFSYSSPSRADDSITGTLASLQVNSIKHLVPLQSLIALTAGGAWRIDAGDQGGAITPATVQAVPQVFNGCSDVAPLVIGRELLYVEAKGTVVRDLSFNVIDNVYSGNDLTALANHLFVGRRIIDWAYAETPFKLVWAVRNDGVLLCFTFVKEQEVYAWTHSDTQGRFTNVCTIPEGGEDAVYLAADRYIGGQKERYFERMASRDMGAVAEGVISLSPDSSAVQTDLTIVPADLTRAWFVDCGLQYPLTYPAGTLFPTALNAQPSIASVVVTIPGSGYTTAPGVTVTDPTGSGAVLVATVVGGVVTAVDVTDPGSGYSAPVITFDGGGGSGAVAYPQMTRDVQMNANASVFSSGSVGSMLRINNGWGIVRVYDNPSQATVNMQHPMSNSWPAEEGEWSCTAPVTVVSGLGHIEGCTAAILADGSVMPPQVVEGGTITLDRPASAIVVGLPYIARFASLYGDIPGQAPTVQGKRKKISAVTVRLQDSRGLRIGNKRDELFAIKERNNEVMGQPILPFTGDQRVTVGPNWDVEGQVFAEQTDPLPCTILALMPELNVGDT